MRTGKNHEGYSDPTASCAVGHLTHEEKQREKKRADEEQIQAIREMQARREEKRQKRRQRKSKANRR